MTASVVQRLAARDPRAVAELRRHPNAQPYVYTSGPGRWQVSWFGTGPHAPELLQVLLDDRGHVDEAWTGFQLAWTMARGYPGAFGRRADAWYVWLSLSLLFVLPFIRRRPSLLHLDLAALLSLSVSLAFFNHGRIGLSVPLAYPPLVYLLVRVLLLGFGRGRSPAPLRLLVPVGALAAMTISLVGFRVALNVADGNVIDVGYAGVLGADRLLHGERLYGGWPSDIAQGDTYGPATYLAYVPFRAALGWSGRWDGLPAAHGAALAFDLLTMVGLFALGRMVRGPSLGWLLAYSWAAFPFTLFTLDSDSNDSLVALLVVAALLLAASRPRRAVRARGAPGPGSPARGTVAAWGAAARGAIAAVAALTKFAPLALAPLLWRGADPPPRRWTLLVFPVAFALVTVALLSPVLGGGDIRAFWRDTIAYQAGRQSPFSVWGLWGGLSGVQHLVQGAAIGLAAACAFVPRRRGLPEVAALAAAVLIALQLGITHWFYLYIPWFFAPAMVALLCAAPEGQAAPGRTWTGVAPDPGAQDGPVSEGSPARSPGL